MKKFVIDLNKDPSVRWNKMFDNKWVRSRSKSMANEAYKDCKKFGFLSKIIKGGCYVLAELFGSTYIDDMYAWGYGPIKDIGISIFANLSYEMYQASNRFLCSSTAIQHKNFNMIHVRNLDWPLSGMSEATIIIKYINGQCGDFYSVSVPGQVGVVSGMAPKRFSASINLAPCKEISFSSSRWSSPFLLRYAFENCYDYTDAVKFIKSAKTVSPTFIQIVGTGKDEACIIETMPYGRNAIRNLDGKFISTTNHYQYKTDQSGLSQEEVDWSEIRLDALEKRSDSCIINKLSDAFNVSNRYPINHEYTMQRMVMCAKTGKLIVRV